MSAVREFQTRVRAHQRSVDRVCDALDTAVPASVTQLQDALASVQRQLRAPPRPRPHDKESSRTSTSQAPGAAITALVAALAIPRELVQIDADAARLGTTTRTRVYAAVCAREPVVAKTWKHPLTPAECAVLCARLARIAAAGVRSAHVLAVRGHTRDAAGQPVCVAQRARAGLPAVWPRSVPAAMDLLAAVAAALAALHAQHIAHANLKPSNVLCDASGSWLLADAWQRRPFIDYSVGVASGASSGSSSSSGKGESTETAPPTREMVYTAPEVRSGAVADPLHHLPGDVYAFGVLVHELLFGPVRTTAPTVPVPPSSTGAVGAEAAALVRDCWAAPEVRPTAAQLCARVAALHAACVLPEPAPAAFWHRHFPGEHEGGLRPRAPWSAITTAIINDCTDAAQPCDPAALEPFRCFLVSQTSESRSEDGKEEMEETVTVEQWRQGYLWFGEWFVPAGEARRAQLAQLFREPWFHGHIARAEALTRLGRPDTAPGAFLVRLSTTRADAPLTLDHRLAAGGTASVRIARNAAHTAYRAPGTPEHPTVARVVDALRKRLGLGAPCPREPPDALLGGSGYAPLFS